MLRNSSTLATSCELLTQWKRLWCWEGLGARGEGDDRGWDGWMASPTQWTWVWVNFGSWWWTGRPGVLQFMGSQRVRHDWATELNWTELNWKKSWLRNQMSRASRIRWSYGSNVINQSSKMSINEKSVMTLTSRGKASYQWIEEWEIRR